MPRHETPAQKETVHRVMHEFKEGELETSAGRKVKNRRQAVAIALSEAGESRDNTPAQNRRNLARTKRGERGEGPTRAALYAEAKRKDIPGRSKMSKAELQKALKH